MTPPTTNQILDDAKELYSQKEDDYGASWRLTGEILSMLIKQEGEDELVIPAEPEYLSALGLYFRRLDKVVRSFNGTFIDGDLSVDEDVSETTEDQIPYSAMQTVLAKEMENMEAGEKAKQSQSSPREIYPKCDRCGEEAVERTALLGEAENYEYYCECGNCWWQ